MASKSKSTPGSVVLQLAPLVLFATVNTFDVPPVPKPVASDMVSKSVWFSLNMSCVLNVPVAEAGIDTFLGVPNTGVTRTE